MKSIFWFLIILLVLFDFVWFHSTFNEWFDSKSYSFSGNATHSKLQLRFFFFFLWFCDIWWLYFRFSKLKCEFRDEWKWWSHFHFECDVFIQMGKFRVRIDQALNMLIVHEPLEQIIKEWNYVRFERFSVKIKWLALILNMKSLVIDHYLFLKR